MYTIKVIYLFICFFFCLFTSVALAIKKAADPDKTNVLANLNLHECNMLYFICLCVKPFYQIAVHGQWNVLILELS